LGTDDQPWLESSGSKITTVSATRASTIAIIDDIVEKEHHVALKIQREMVDEGKPLHETEAGRVLYQSWLDEKNAMEDLIATTKIELEQAIDQHHGRKMIELRETLSQLQDTGSTRSHALRGLEKNASTLCGLWEQKLEREMKQLRQRSEENERQLQQLQQLLSKQEAHLPPVRYGDTKAVEALKETQEERAALDRIKVIKISTCSLASGVIRVAASV